MEPSRLHVHGPVKVKNSKKGIEESAVDYLMLSASTLKHGARFGVALATSLIYLMHVFSPESRFGEAIRHPSSHSWYLSLIASVTLADIISYAFTCAGPMTIAGLSNPTKEQQDAYRSHYCRRCEQLVVRFDHHCLFTGSDIGAGNYSWFLFYLTAQSVLLWLSAHSAIYGMHQGVSKLLLFPLSLYLLDGASPPLVLSLATLLSVAIACLTSGLLLFNLWIASRHYTARDYFKSQPVLNAPGGALANLYSSIFAKDVPRTPKIL